MAFKPHHLLGTKHSDEWKLKISQGLKRYLTNGGIPTHTGHKMSDETKLKISRANKGKKRDDEFKKVVSLRFKGKKVLRTKEWNENQRKIQLAIVRRGASNPLWKGGSKMQEQIRKCYRYRQWRSDVFTRDDFTCTCGQRGGDINADHIKQFELILRENNIKCIEDALICEELWNINNGRTLCLPCHKLTATYSKKIK